MGDISCFYANVRYPRFCINMNFSWLVEAEWRIYVSVNYAITVSDNGMPSSQYLGQCWHSVNWAIEKQFVKFDQNNNNKIWICRLQNGSHFVQASMC